MSKNSINGKIMQNRQKEKIQFQTSFTDFPVFILYCKCVNDKNGIHKNEINRVLGTARNTNGSWNQKFDSHACISLLQYKLIKLVGEKYILDELGKQLISLFDAEFNLIGTRQQYVELTFKMITSWHQNTNNYNIHPGEILLKLLLEPSLHGYITSQDVAHIFNNSNNKTDSQYPEMVNQVIEFRNSGRIYTREELKKTYTLLTGFVKWDIFNLDDKHSSSIIKTVYMKEDFHLYAKSALSCDKNEIMSDADFKDLVQSTSNLRGLIDHLTSKYGESGRTIGTYEKRLSQVQDVFRSRLIKQFGQKCMMCEVSNQELLIASHIKRDADCATIEEKIDSNNGFLLCANHDKLFDKFLISFDGMTGEILISSKLTQREKEIFLLDPDYILPSELLTPERQLYLIWHNSEFYKKENGGIDL